MELVPCSRWSQEVIVRGGGRKYHGNPARSHHQRQHHTHTISQIENMQSETCQKGMREGKAINIARTMAMPQVRKEANT